MDPWHGEKSPFESSLLIPPTQNIRFEAGKRNLPKTMLEVEITEYDKVKDGREAYYRYHIQANQTKRTPHRYSEFEWLRAQLSLKHPGCVTPLLPPKEGVSSYIYSHEASFYEYRRHGLEVFLRAVAANSKLSGTEELRSFLEDDELNFGLKVRDSTEHPGVLARVWDVGSSVAASVTWYIYGDQQGSVTIGETSGLEDEIESLYTTIREESEGAQSMSLTLVPSTQTTLGINVQSSIQHNHNLAQAYLSLTDLDTSPQLRLAYKVHSDAHNKAAGVLRDMEQRLRDLCEKEAQDYIRWTMGGLEAWQRRQQLINRIIEERQSMQQDRERSLQKIETMETDLREAGLDLKRDLGELREQLARCKAKLIETFVGIQRKGSEDMKAVWSEAQVRLSNTA